MHRAVICRIEGNVKVPATEPTRIFESPNTIRTVVWCCRACDFVPSRSLQDSMRTIWRMISHLICLLPIGKSMAERPKFAKEPSQATQRKGNASARRFAGLCRPSTAGRATELRSSADFLVDECVIIEADLLFIICANSVGLTQTTVQFVFIFTHNSFRVARRSVNFCCEPREQGASRSY